LTSALFPSHSLPSFFDASPESLILGMSRLFALLIALAGLEASAQTYQSIHQKAILVDTHNDVLYNAVMKGLNIESDLRGKTHSDLARLRQGGVDIQVFSVFCDERFGKDTAFKYANIVIDSLYAIVRRNPSQMMMVRDPAQLRQALRQKKLGCMIGVEGGHMIEDSIGYLETLYRRGARYLTLTWNNSTSWATSAMDETTRKDSLKHIGLTAHGKKIVRRMNELGMLVDVSHVGEQTFWDVMQTTTQPVIASHSCTHTLCPVFRNLKDEQIRAIGKNGGVIHLNFYSGFVDSSYLRRQKAFLASHQREVDSLKAAGRPGYEIDEWLTATYPREQEALRPTIDGLIDHLDHIVKLAGVDHVGMGSDFDGISSAPVGLDDVSHYPNITKALLQRGYSKKDIEKILGGNFIRVFKAVQSARKNSSNQPKQSLRS
jgi:membrane dipeptidase